MHTRAHPLQGSLTWTFERPFNNITSNACAVVAAIGHSFVSGTGLVTAWRGDFAISPWCMAANLFRAVIVLLRRLVIRALRVPPERVAECDLREGDAPGV